MKTYHFDHIFTHVPPVLKRGQHALIAVEDESGNIILGGKHIYPEGIYRLIGGGIEADEDPKIGAIRELEEELGITVQPEDLDPFALVELDLKETETDKDYHFKTYLYHLKTDQTLDPADDLDSIKHFSKEEIQELIDRYYNLPDKLITIADDWDEAFRWSDYGRVYGKMHEIVLQQLDNNS